MAYDEGLAQRIRDVLRDTHGATEKNMFGGVCFLLRGHMMLGIAKGLLMVRIGPAAEAAALKKPGARPMDFTGRPLKGYVYVDPDFLAEDSQLEEWIALGRKFVEGLPDKPVKASPRRRERS